MSFDNHTIGSLGEYPQLTSEQALVESNLYEFSLILSILGSLSLLGCLFNITITFLLKLHRNVLGKMMICLSVTDFIYTMAIGCPIWRDLPAANIIFNFAWAGSVIWGCSFADTLYNSAKFGEELLDDSLLKKYFVMSVIFSAIGGLLQAPIFNSFIPSISFWFNGIIAIISIIYCSYCYIIALKKIREYKMDVSLELLSYPLILIICEIPFVILQFYNIFCSPVPKELGEIAMIVLASRGICNSLAYGLSSRIKQGIKLRCGKVSQKERHETLLASYVSESTQYEIISYGSLKPPNFVLKFSSVISQS